MLYFSLAHLPLAESLASNPAELSTLKLPSLPSLAVPKKYQLGKSAQVSQLLGDAAHTAE